MSECWVVNASPVILLARVGRLDLLERQCARLLLPAEVAQEIRAGSSSDPARLAIDKGWAERIPMGPPNPSVLEWGLGAGETSVITVALRQDSALAVLDDRLARTAARSHGVSVIGTLGVVLRAKRAGLIAQAAPLLTELQRSGLYIRRDLMAEALGKVGEQLESQ
ncbi:MAG: DUF3368 domain-containing protein [Phycisphaeraceae bacterium]|nr:DUF3368 domain-containing protein [Phycisphaeraceae bacterium]